MHACTWTCNITVGEETCNDTTRVPIYVHVLRRTLAHIRHEATLILTSMRELSLGSLKNDQIQESWQLV